MNTHHLYRFPSTLFLSTNAFQFQFFDDTSDETGIKAHNSNMEI